LIQGKLRLQTITGRIARPDRITFDLDPGERVPWSHVQEAAILVRLMLTELRLPAFLKTSGGNGPWSEYDQAAVSISNAMKALGRSDDHDLT
jgi:hypothetical protein